MKTLILWTLILVFKYSLQGKLMEDFYYGGVAEIAFATNGTSDENLQANLETYLRLLDISPTQTPDILVFPESTLNDLDTSTFVPNPNDEIFLCDQKSTNIYEPFLIKLSCEARRLATYLVINLTEKEKCETNGKDIRLCAPSGLNVFNTNVVFDRRGKIISRYRKFHLYGENKNTTFVPEFGMFETDFGVTFGHFICFDILFYTPVQKMVTVFGITDFLFPTMWFSQLPFLTGVQFQASWAFGNGVNLLAAGSSLPKIGTTGTGIYNGKKGALFSHVSLKEPDSLLTIVQVPIYKTLNYRHKRSIAPLEPMSMRKLDDHYVSISQNDIFLKRDYLEYYVTIPIDFAKGFKQDHDLCFNETGFCCHFELEWTNNSVSSDNDYYNYRLAVFDGWRNEEAAEVNKIKNCAIISCIGGDIKDCGKLFPESNITYIYPNLVFSKLLISALYPQSDEYLLMPNSLQSNLKPLDVQHFEWINEEVEIFGVTKQNVSLFLKRATQDLLTFAIYGNYFNGTEKGGATMLFSSSYILVTCLLSNKLFS